MRNRSHRLMLTIAFCLLSAAVPAAGQEHPRTDITTGAQGLPDTDSLFTRAALLMRRDPDSAIYLLQGLYAGCREAHQLKGMIRSLNMLANTFNITGRYPEALQSLRAALPYALRAGSAGNLTAICNNLGNTFFFLSDYEQAAQGFLLALAFRTRSADAGQPIPVSHIYNNLAGVFIELDRESRARYYFNRAFHAASAESDRAFMANVLLNAGSRFLKANDYRTAAHYFRRSAHIASQAHAYDKLYLAYAGLGNLFTQTNDPETALHYIQQAKELAAAHTIQHYGQGFLNAVLGDLHLLLQDPDKASAYFMQSLGTPISTKERSYIYRQLAQLHYDRGAYRDAFDYREKYHRIKDSIAGQQVAMNVSRMELRYQSAEKDRELSEAGLMLSLQQQKISRRNILIAGFALVMALSGAGIFIYLHQRRRKDAADKKLIQLRARIEGSESEKARMAQDLHDGVCSQLTAAQSFMLVTQQELPVLRANPEFITAKTIIDEAMGEIRSIAHNLSPEPLIHTSLIRAVENFCRKIFGSTAIGYHFHHSGDPESLAPSLKLGIYRIIQELSANIVRHSAASEANILLVHTGELLQLTIEDNGKGLPESYGAAGQPGLGLQGVRERVHMHGATMEIESQENKFTNIVITFTLGLTPSGPPETRHHKP